MPIALIVLWHILEMETRVWNLKLPNRIQLLRIQLLLSLRFQRMWTQGRPQLTRHITRLPRVFCFILLLLLEEYTQTIGIGDLPWLLEESWQ